MNEEKLKELLGEDEKIIFSASPTKKLYTKNELIRLPISILLIGGFLIYYYFFATIDPMVLALTIAVGLVFIIYNGIVKTILKANKRKNTFYYLTDKNVFFILTKANGEIKKSKSFKVTDFPSVSVVMNKDETGSLLFSETREIENYPLRIGDNWISYPGGVVPFFFDITNPNEAKEKFLEVKKSYVTEQEELGDKPFSKFDQ